MARFFHRDQASTEYRVEFEKPLLASATSIPLEEESFSLFGAFIKGPKQIRERPAVYEYIFAFTQNRVIHVHAPVSELIRTKVLWAPIAIKAVKVQTIDNKPVAILEKNAEIYHVDKNEVMWELLLRNDTLKLSSLDKRTQHYICLGSESLVAAVANLTALTSCMAMYLDEKFTNRDPFAPHISFLSVFIRSEYHQYHLVLKPRSGPSRFQPINWQLCPADWADNVVDGHEQVASDSFQADIKTRIVMYEFDDNRERLEIEEEIEKVRSR